MFYSENFTYDSKHGVDYGIQLVSESSDILNEYGVNFSDNNEITLTFCYTDSLGNPLTWDENILKFVHSWFLQDNYCKFVSDDNSNIFYYLKGFKIVKRFNSELKGLIDVTFELYDNCAYRSQIYNFTSSITINNISNVGVYKPVIVLNGISSNSIIINNTTNSKSLSIDTTGITSLVIDNYIGTVTSGGLNLISKCNRDWILLNEGANSINVVGKCNVSINCEYPIRM